MRMICLKKVIFLYSHCDNNACVRRCSEADDMGLGRSLGDHSGHTRARWAEGRPHPRQDEQAGVGCHPPAQNGSQVKT